MLFSSLVAAVCFIAAGAQARYVKRDDGLTIFSRKAVAKRAPSEVVVSSAVLPLTRKAATGASAARRQGLSKLLIANGSTTTLTSLFTGEEFAAEVEFGTQTFEMIVDTGSSDTWVVETGFVCMDLDTGKATTEAYCDFGPYYTKSSTFAAISGEIFSIEYGDGEYLTGIMGTEEVTVAGITVDQEVALVTAAAWGGDGTTSGLMGLAYPALYMILDAGDGVCISGWMDGGSSNTEDVFILGDTFQKNVVTLFDVGAATLQFAGREFYASDDTY